jgi:uncharacterized repeat protein (TIGR01451 family)
MQVTFYRGGAPETLSAPFVMGLRPGYVYRVQVSGMPGHPNQTFFPTLEVRGSVQLPPMLRPANFPVPFVFSDDDFGGVRGGALLTRIALLEQQEVAIPEATRPDQPIEITVPAGRDAEAAAREHGRPLLAVRLGQRQYSAEELACQAVPGTVLLPGETFLPPARDPPTLAWSCVPLYDPVLGPADTTDAACIPDGGDAGLPAGLDAQGRLRGLDPGDTVAVYADSCGWRHIAISNRICICVPRYLVIRTAIVPAAELALVAPFNAQAAKGQGVLLAGVPPLAWQQAESLVGLAARQRLSGSVLVTGPVVVGRVAGAEVVATLESPGGVTGVCPKVVHTVERPLCIIKWPDRNAAQIGDVLTFYLRYTNQGGLPITDVVVSDSLSARFEYVPGSARSDRDAVFTTQPNEAGSVIVRWEVAGALPPGQSGTVSFQVRIR